MQSTEKSTIRRDKPKWGIKCADSWDQAKSILTALSGDWAFRGQQESRWDLTTTLERAAQSEGKKGLWLKFAESMLVREFVRKARTYAREVPQPYSNELLDWLALMQHHGAPTRLLDWTKSPYVASYFALENAKGTSAVWAVDITWLREQGVIAMNNPREPETSLGHKVSLALDVSTPTHFIDVFFKHNIPLVLPVEPFRMSERHMMQQGLFLCIGDIDRGFMGNLEAFNSSQMGERLVKIEMPVRLRDQGLSDLDRMNISKATLFPGLEGLGQSIKLHIRILDDRIIKADDRRAQLVREGNWATSSWLKTT